MATDDAEKVSLYPSRKRFVPGQLASVLLVSGRAEFRTNRGEVGPPVTLGVVPAIDQFLARADLRPFVSLGDLVDAIWTNVIAPLWWLCPDCRTRRSEDAEFHADDPDGESTCDAHDALLTIIAVGFDAADPGTPKLYQRTWIVGAQSAVLEDGLTYVDAEDGFQALARQSIPGYDNLCRQFVTYAEQVNRNWFMAARDEASHDAQEIDRDARLATATIEGDADLTDVRRTEKLKATALRREVELQAISKRSTVGPIGGRVASHILDPVTGFEHKPDWYLLSSANDGQSVFDRSEL